jgi:hypothetical protein
MIPVRTEFQNVIESPGASFNDMYTMKPLTMIVNNPSVNNIAGSDNMITMGLRMLLTSEKINPAERKTHTLATDVTSVYPVPNIRTATHSPNELSIQRMMNVENCCFIYYLSLYRLMPMLSIDDG